MAGRGDSGRRRGEAVPRPSRALQAALDRLGVAFALFDAKRRLAAWNAPLASLRFFSKRLLKRGTPLEAFLRAEAQQRGTAPTEIDPQVRARLAELSRRARTELELPLAQERVLRVSSRRVPPRNLLFSYEDVTDAHLAALRDVAQRKEHELELRRARDDATAALQQQTAIGEILRAISGSPEDVRPVLAAVAERAAQICASPAVDIWLAEAGEVHMAAHFGELGGLEPGARLPIDRNFLIGHAILERRVVHLGDAQGADGARYPLAHELARKSGNRTMLAVPLLREDKALGAIVLRRQAVQPFSEEQIALLGTFADQASIAIENVRLFNETKAALERQTATAEILKVMASSPSDVRPVFDAIAASARRLLGGRSAVVVRRVADTLHLAAHTATNEAGDAALRKLFPTPLAGEGAMGKAILSQRPSLVTDIEADPTYSASFREGARARGIRSMCVVPMMCEGEAVGAIAVSRAAPGSFAEHQVELLETFADQAVIAIENVRLFNETREALERQTATAEILKVIASSPSDVQPVFDAILEGATRLCESHLAVMNLFDGRNLRTVAQRGGNEEFVKWAFGRGAFEPSGGLAVLLETRRPLQRADIMDSEYYRAGSVNSVNFVHLGGARSILLVPLLKDDQFLGNIAVYRPDVGAFTQRQVELVSTFASQAVIAIENVRLFSETREALERQTATAEILKAISSSPTDTKPVFDAIVQSAVRLFDGLGVGISLVEGGHIRMVAMGGSGQDSGSPQAQLTLPMNRDSAAGSAIADQAIVNVGDTEAAGVPRFARENGRALGFRAIAAAPLLREGVAIGALAVTRRNVGAFSDRQLTMLQTFASQAVIAIENVRLFNELQERTEALTKSVRQLTALGEVGQAISSTLDLETVLKTIVSRAVQLTGLDGGSIYEFDGASASFHLRAAQNMPEALVETYRTMPIRLGEGIVGRAAQTREPVQVPDIEDASYQTRYKELLLRQGYRAILAVPLAREDQVIGALTVSRNKPGPFASEVVELLKTFASQSALAIQNARLFREIAKKSRQLEVASQHKSQFLASMSHELRTPLNAILGFNEMILDQIYGEVPEDIRAPLENIQSSGKHLLRLINNVLDLAKIEAGRMELALSDYSVQDTVASVHSTLKPLAAEKGLEFLASVPNDIPLGYGDAGRIAQCLMNLAGNSLKFTKLGKVEIAVAQKDQLLRYSVADTGIGIPPEKIASLFTEFKQTDATIASEYGGTGLGLSISKKFVEMHGGRIWVESEPGKGSAFIFEIPLRAGTP